MREKTLEAMRYLYMYGPCYKSDFIKLLGNRGDQTFGRLQKMVFKHKGAQAILEKEIDVEEKKKTGQTATIVSLSPAGVSFYKEHERKEVLELRLPAARKTLFETKQLTRVLHPHLTTQRVFIMYHLAGVACFSYEKPSLGFLAYYLHHDKFGIKKPPYAHNYLDRYYEPKSEGLKENELLEFLDKGAYYTKEEVMAYLKSVDKGSADAIKGVRWHGLFVSNTNMFVNFVLSYGENIRMYVYSEALANLLARLRRYIAVFTNVQRRIPSVTDYSVFRPQVYENDIDAITIGIGSSHTYSEALGNKRGRIKGKDLTILTSKQTAYDVIDCTSRRFKRIYSINDRSLGIDMLRYITSCSLEAWQKEATSIFEEDQRFEVSKKSELFKYTYLPLNVRAIYMPVYEIKMLKKLADEAKKDNKPVLIVTRREMMETISHCVHIEYIEDILNNKHVPGLWFIEYEEDKESIYLSDFVDEKSGVFNIYNSRGYVAGKMKVDEYLQDKGLKLNSDGEYIKLVELVYKHPKKLTTPQEIKCSFFNEVARKGAERFLDPYVDSFSIDPAASIRFIESKPVEKKAIRYSSKMIGVKVSLELKKNITQIVDEKSINTSSLVRRITKNVVDKTIRLSKKKGISLSQALDTVLKAVDDVK